MPNPGGISASAVQTLTSLATTPTGDLIAGGYTTGFFNNYQNPSHKAESFLAAFSSSGALLWIKQFGNSGGDFLRGVVVDQSGNIYTTGTASGTLAGNSNPTSNIQGTIRKFDQAGLLMWEQEFSIDGGYTAPSAISIAQNGSLAIGGTYTHAGSSNPTTVFIRQMNGATGLATWTSRIGSASVSELCALASDADGNVYATGSTAGFLPVIAGAILAPFVTRLNATSGNIDWSVPVPTQTTHAVIVPASLSYQDNAITLGGSVSSSKVAVGFGADPDAAGFVTQLNSKDGSMRWTHEFATGLGDEIIGIATDRSGDIFTVGITRGVFAAGFHQPQDDVFLLRLSPAGENISASQVGTGPFLNGSANGPTIATNPKGAVFVGSATDSAFPGFTNPKREIQAVIEVFLY